MTTASVRRALPAIAAALLAAALSLGNGAWRLDNALYDALIARWPHPTDPRLLIVAIDDRSMQALGPWPWPRKLHAQLLDRLDAAGAAVVALDLVFSEADRVAPAQDAQLAAALRRNARTVLPVIGGADAGQLPQELLPTPAIAGAAAALAHTDIPIDADGVSRGVYLHAGLGSAHWPALGATLASGALPALAPPAPARDAMPYQWHRADYVALRFAGPPDSLAEVSYVDVLRGQVAAQALRGRHVIVGMTATGMGQRFRTPMSSERWMSGPEYQANVAATLLGNAAIVPLSRATQAGVAALLALLAAIGLSCPQRSSRWPWLALPGALALPVAGSAAWLLLGGRWFAPGACLVALGVVAAGWLGVRVAQWRRHAQRDALTGLANRHGFELAFRHALAAARRSGKPLAMILLDVDHFKRYNDSLGHQVGDHALVLVAAAVARHTRRRGEVAARFGGDEFAIVLPDTGTDAACRTAEAILADIRQLVLPAAEAAEQPLTITATLGVHSARLDAHSRQHDFFEHADAALYRAKRAGRNGYACSEAGRAADAPSGDY
ncbi:CHASE2 domain-containing protein [Xanthomonas campestris pv. phormiicola]|nr:CHASE2 domain-containing protein [Xanthomonas campestris pv. phormiicola]UYC14964.1 CHASE2 domain-containing protein [Xanthomonas campestris pv. phormiicola]